MHALFSLSLSIFTVYGMAIPVLVQIQPHPFLNILVIFHPKWVLSEHEKKGPLDLLFSRVYSPCRALRPLLLKGREGGSLGTEATGVGASVLPRIWKDWHLFFSTWEQQDRAGGLRRLYCNSAVWSVGFPKHAWSRVPMEVKNLKIE